MKEPSSARPKSRPRRLLWAFLLACCSAAPGAAQPVEQCLYCVQQDPEYLHCIDCPGIKFPPRACQPDVSGNPICDPNKVGQGPSSASTVTGPSGAPRETTAPPEVGEGAPVRELPPPSKPPAGPSPVQTAPAGSEGGGILGIPYGGAPHVLGGMSAANDRESQQALAAAEAHYGAGRWEEAARAATRSIQLHPENPKGYAILAGAQNGLRHHEAAEKAARESIRQFKRNPTSHQHLAWAQLRQGKFQEAAKTAEQLSTLDPKSGLARALLAYAAAAQGDRKAALEYLRQAAGLDPRFQAKYAQAQKGGSIYEPDDSDASLLGLAKNERPRRGWPLVLGGLAALAAGAAGGLWLLPLLLARRKKRADDGRVHLTPAPWNEGLLGGKYEVGKLIGRGGMGSVHEAVDKSLGRTVAVKRMDASSSGPGTKWRGLFLKEARAVAAVHHPAIVDIYEILEDRGEIFLVFEFVKGRTLHQILAEERKIALERAVRILKPVCKALEFAHASGLVHRDLKPANVMVTASGDVKLMDFGLARALSAAGEGSFTKTQTIMGTPVYMAPECAQGIVSKEGDVYALGVTLYEMLSGQLPFPFDNSMAAKIEMSVEQLSKKDRAIPPEIDALILAALQPSPALRLKTPREFLKRLRAAAKLPSDTPA